ncbi:hypothetical protein [Chryseobacterium indoltheticum]
MSEYILENSVLANFDAMYLKTCRLQLDFLEENYFETIADMLSGLLFYL